VRRLLLVALALGGCGDDGAAPPDAAPNDAAPSDAAPNDAAPDTEALDAGADAAPVSPLFGKVVFNEVLIDGLAEGDPNGDGDVNAVEDQFVELVNVDTEPVALDGCTLVELDLPDVPRHTFAGFTLPAGHAVVIFGGGDAPPATATAVFFTANAADPGIPWGLHLSTPVDSLSLLDATGLTVARFCYGGSGECSQAAASDESLTRSPELTGSFVPHTTVGAGGSAFSPGSRADGTAF
jgi:hypothetical protein